MKKILLKKLKKVMSEGSEWALCIYSSKKPLSYTESRAHALIHLGEPMKIETRKNQRDFANLTGILIGLCVAVIIYLLNDNCFSLLIPMNAYWLYDE